ncbi:MAG TPA: divergent PAP2 family protein [Dictyoglomaceae bacterium]|nr:divergent PAP2 family protein [Dictyoglomaceae bacterium]HOL39681.1 divergent PAP2 family protein [Dictyoglomaceae bacterium]HOP94783.1 divergent PAP2 family protein [Dictyoglomaceae bacterium]HPP16050.1 divergent PAP2 family protein [Dictyoglomaceae bacterium]HPU44226.1 divergent PAP2 family protein [Dictyoglomaceae bacterium]
MWIIEIALDLLRNPIFVIPIFIAILTQVVKGTIRSIQEKRLIRRAFFEWGGMPSSHSALVVSLSLIIGLKNGFDSSIFILSTFFAGFVIADAIGVRLASEEQAKVINKILRNEIEDKELKNIRLKESIGHTPIEAFIGGIIGFVLAYLIYQIVFTR